MSQTPRKVQAPIPARNVRARPIVPRLRFVPDEARWRAIQTEKSWLAYPEADGAGSMSRILREQQIEAHDDRVLHLEEQAARWPNAEVGHLQFTLATHPEL